MVVSRWLLDPRLVQRQGHPQLQGSLSYKHLHQSVSLTTWTKPRGGGGQMDSDVLLYLHTHFSGGQLGRLLISLWTLAKLYIILLSSWENLLCIRSPDRAYWNMRILPFPLLVHMLDSGPGTSVFNKRSLRNSELDFSYDNWKYLNFIFNQMLFRK